MSETAAHATIRRNTQQLHNNFAAIKALTVIPGIGKSLAADLIQLGFYKVEDLRGQDPQQMYDRLSQLSGCPQDRCVLYVFRCAVYFAQEPTPDPELLKWWNWKGNWKSSRTAK